MPQRIQNGQQIAKQNTFQHTKAQTSPQASIAGLTNGLNSASPGDKMKYDNPMLFRQTLEGRDRRPIVPKIPHVAPAVYESDAAVVSFTKRLAQSSVWRENTPPPGRCGLPTRRGRGADDYRPQDMNVPRLQQQFYRQTARRHRHMKGRTFSVQSQRRSCIA